MPEALKYYVDWDHSGTFGGDNEDITAYVLRSSWGRGQRNPEPGSAQAGECSIVLDNSSGIFSSFNEDSPLFGSILPGRRISITSSIDGGPDVIMWRGYLDSLIPTPGPVVEVSTAELRGQGIISQLVDRKISVALQENITTGAAAALALDAAGIGSGIRELDTGLTTLAKWWARKDAQLLDILKELEAAEAGRLGETKDGKLLFAARSREIGASVLATYGSTLFPWNLRQEDHLRGIYNRVEAQYRTFNESEDVILATVTDVRNAEGGTPPIVPAGGSLVVEIKFPADDTPASYLAVKDWTFVDFEANTAADASGDDITVDVDATREEFADKIVLTFTNANGAAAHLILLRAHGVALVEGTPVAVPADDLDSQDDFRVKLYPNPSQWLTERLELDDYCAHTLALWKDPRPRLVFDVKGNYNAAHLAEVQARDVGDRVRIIAEAPYGLGIDEEFTVEYMFHQVDEARLHTMQVLCKAVLEHEWPASAYPRDGTIIDDFGPPDQIRATAIATGRRFTFGVEALKWNHTIYEAEFRVKLYAPTTEPTEVDMRLASEGGADFDPVGSPTTDILCKLGADHNGANMELIVADQRRAYYAARLRNIRGWSVWSDGNNKPRHVKQNIAAEDPATADDGPPSGWEVLPVKAGPSDNTVVVSATRPTVFGRRILWFIVQIRDITTGEPWRLLDANTGAAATIYDGSAIAHTYNKALGTLEKMSGGDYPALSVGDLILFDVRGGAFDVQNCQWGTVSSVTGAVLHGLFGFRPRGSLVAGESSCAHDDDGDIRIKIVRRPDQWNTEGYLGDEPNNGFWYRELFGTIPAGDTATEVFESAPIAYPSTLALEDLEARVWFENAYSRGDDGANHSTGVASGGDVPDDTFPTITTDFRTGKWIVVPGNPAEVTLTFNGVGGLRMQGARAFDSNIHRNMSGVMTRGRFFPDAAGILRFKVKFANFIQPSDQDTSNRIFNYVMAFDIGAGVGEYVFWGLGKKMAGSQIGFEFFKRLSDGQVSTLIGGTSSVLTDGGDFTIDVKLDYIVFSGTYDFALDGFRADYSTGPIAYVYTNQYFLSAIPPNGVKVFLGVIQADATNVGEATLESFEIVNGTYVA